MKGPLALGKGTWAFLILLAACAALSNTRLFQQVVQGRSDLTKRIAPVLGGWTLIDEYPATESEIQGLETSDIIKRTYSDGRDVVELVVAYIAHSSRKSAHAQEACLRGSGALVGKIENRRLARTPVSAKAIGIDIQDRHQQVYYWYKIGKVYTADYLMSSLKMFLGGLVGSQHQGASLIRLLTPTRKGEGQAGVDARLEDFTVHLLPELEKHLP